MDEKIDWEKIDKIFFVGIKGVGMTPLSIICKKADFIVSGADVPEEFITDEVLAESGIQVFKNFNVKDIEEFFGENEKESCLVITTGAHSGYNNPLVKWANSKNISVLNQGQALGIFMTGKPLGRTLKGITVTGSHGKTTISAMLSCAFSYLNLDPTFSVGTSRIFPTGASGHYGKGDFFIAEGDEYVGEPVFDRTPKILYQQPEMAIVNNIDFDHPDVYKDINEVKETILKFINNMKSHGTVFINSDDLNLTEIKSRIKKDLEIKTYGNGDADYSISQIETNLGSVKFNVSKKGSPFEVFELKIPGIHNAQNTLAVISLLDNMGIEKNLIKSAVESYKGCKRRMELVGETQNGAVIVDDYGHHPSEIKSTIKAITDFYGKKIVCVFQSHTYSRTKELWSDFLKSFGGVEELVLLPVFRSQRDTEQDIISDIDFAEDLSKNVGKVHLSDGIEDAAGYLEELVLNREQLILTIGAGDVYKVGYALKK